MHPVTRSKLDESRDARELDAFASIRVEHDTVVWKNGFDLAPE